MNRLKASSRLTPSFVSSSSFLDRFRICFGRLCFLRSSIASAIDVKALVTFGEQALLCSWRDSRENLLHVRP
jgi:hypothetical protein